MKEFIIDKNSEKRRLLNYLKRVMPNASEAFLHKMLRKKNITLNDKKADGKELLNIDDVIKVYFSDDTFDKMKEGSSFDDTKRFLRAYRELKDIRIIYEDTDIIVFYKPKGILSQSDKSSDISLNEYLIGYLLSEDSLKPESLKDFKPSVLNRLDRNTDGLILCGRSLNGSREVSKMIKEHTIKKYYLTTVKGIVRSDLFLEGYLVKDEKTNKVTISKDKVPGSSYINTVCYPVREYDDRTDLKVLLNTGKTHQIRAHLSFAGYPVLGDEKYGDREFNRKHNVHTQTLTSYEFEFPKDCPLEALSGKVIKVTD